MRANRFSTLLLVTSALLASRVFAIGEDEFLPPEDAFKYTVSATTENVTVEWHATKGYYLYKKRMGLSTTTPGVTVGDSVYPKGEVHKDDYFGESEVFRGDFKVSAPVKGAKPDDTIALKLKWQGCADAGLCYPPTVWDATAKVAGESPRNKADEAFNRARPVATGDDEFVDPDVAFVLTADSKSAGNIQLNWRIADGYYLYRQRIKVESADAARPVTALTLPKGLPHKDEYFGEQEIYRESLDASFSVPTSGPNGADIKVTYQGCADAGLCYPPITKHLTVASDGSVSIAGGEAATASPAATASIASTEPGENCGGYVSEQDSWAQKIATLPLVLVMLGAFATGLGMAFTPCVLPMVPILSGIIAGGGEQSSALRSFMLSVCYVLGMALTYTAAGVAAAAIGNGLNLQATFNQPWIVALFSLLFIVLAISMFGVFTIEMPSFIQTRISEISGKQQAGTYVGVIIMGALSALIVSACVAPPIIGVLTYISQTGNLARGAGVLFVMTIGMGTPLLVVGASAGRLLPRAGAWMETVKNLFGVLFLAVAAWMLARILPGWASMLLWAVPALLLAWVLWRAVRKPGAGAFALRAAAIVAGVYGLMLLAGPVLGSTNPLAPLPMLAGKKEPLEFKRIKTVADLEREVAAAHAAGRGVMLDFYADWCVSCKEMEHDTFPDPEVHKALRNVTLLQADVTHNDDADRELYKHFHIVGPPTIAFYGADGQERRNFRVVGFMEAGKFATVIRQAMSSTCQAKSK